MECKEDGKTDFFTIYCSHSDKKAVKGGGNNEKFCLKRYNPRLKKHCIYTETKLK